MYFLCPCMVFWKDPRPFPYPIFSNINLQFYSSLLEYLCSYDQCLLVLICFFQQLSHLLHPLVSWFSFFRQRQQKQSTFFNNSFVHLTNNSFSLSHYWVARFNQSSPNFLTTHFSSFWGAAIFNPRWNYNWIYLSSLFNTLPSTVQP